MQRIRVLRIIARMNVGGPAVQISGLMRHLDPDEFDQRLVTGYCAADEADYLETQAPDVTATRIPGLGRAIKPTDDVKTVPRLVAMIRDFRPHIIHTHTAKAGALGRTAAILARTDAMVVHTFHGHLLHGYFSPRKTQAVVQLERALAKKSDALIAVGSQVRDDLLAAKIGTQMQYRIIPPGLELGPLRERREARTSLRLDPDRPVIGMIGRLTAIKRPDRFLEVVEIVSKDHPEAQFVVAGAGDQEATLRQGVERNHLPVTMLGWRSDIEDILSACDMIVLTSDNEGTPLSLIQAAMAGLPVVATDVGSVRDVVIDGQSGLLRRTDARDLATAVNSLLSDTPAATALGVRARKLATSLYGVSRLAGDHGNLYRSITAGHA